MGKQAITWFYSRPKERAVCRTAEELDTNYCLKNNYPSAGAATKNMNAWIDGGWRETPISEFQELIKADKQARPVRQVKIVSPVVYKSLGNGLHQITLTSEVLVVLASAVNLQEAYFNDDDTNEVLAKSVGVEAVITTNRVWELSEELITNIPSNFDKWGEPTDDFNGESEHRDAIQVIINDLKYYAIMAKYELFINYTPRQWVEFVDACDRYERPYNVCMDEMAAAEPGDSIWGQDGG